MKKVFRTVGTIVLAALLLGVFALLFSTVRGTTTWYFRENGQVLVDGRPTSGYMHANTERTALLITRTDGTKNETYLVPVADRGALLDCGNWSPIHFVPTPVREANPPCSVSPDPASTSDPPVSKTLQRDRRSLTFSTTSGKKVKAEW